MNIKKMSLYAKRVGGVFGTIACCAAATRFVASSSIKDNAVNGDYLRSRTNYQYFSVVDKNVKLGEVHNHICDFRELEEAISMKEYNPEKHNILRLEFNKNKDYYVENYQAIDMFYKNGVKQKPDVTIINMSLEELRNITPKFKPLP